MSPWSTWSVSALACCFYLCGWAYVSRRHAPAAQPAGSAGTAGANQSGSQATRRGTASYAERKLRGLRRATMMSDTKPPDKPAISEEFFAEWVKYGFAELNIYMVKHAQFDAWLLRHPKPTKEENTE